MNALQFKKLKIGDRILTYNGACTTVTDIDRMAGKLTCGNGQWRDYHRVRMAVETELLVEHKRVQDYVPPIEYVRNLVPVMIREGLIQRKVVKRGLFRLTINK